MRAAHQLLVSRTRVESRYAVMPLEGYPASRLPQWPGVTARVLASPALGAEFVEYLLEIPADHRSTHLSDGGIETFFYLLDGDLTLTASDARPATLKTGSFALVSPQADFTISATTASRVLMLRKEYEVVAEYATPATLVGHESQVAAEPFLGNPGARLQMLIPDEPEYDLAMNIFAFDPGHSLPVVETHVMEHGLYFLQGKGLYYLDRQWMEVEADDFIWMGPYVPQSFYATGPQPAKYLYYKNVNRDVPM